MHCPRTFLLVTFSLICRINFIGCATLEFYSGRNYTGFVKKVIVDETKEKECIVSGDLLEIRSVKTDKCVILYSNWDCSQGPISGYPDYLYSIRVDNNTDHFDIREDLYRKNIFTERQQDERFVLSFHVCSEERGGGPALNVDMYEKTYYFGDILSSWKGVCKCKNIPSSIYHKIVSINNHGNSMHIFNKENCRGHSALIPAGDSQASRYVGVPGDDRLAIRSFRPAGSLDCLKLDASIYKFTFSNGSLSGEPLEKHVQMGSTQTLTNTDSLPKSQIIEFSGTAANTVEYTVASAFTQIHSARVATDVVTETSTGIPWVGQAKLKLSLKEKYQYTKNHQETKTNKMAVRETETVEATTMIEVQVAAYERCDLTGYIKIVQDFPINYTVEAVVKGMAGKDLLPAGEIPDYLPPGMEYMRNKDAYSVLVSVDGSMQTEISWKTFVTKECEPVPNCGKDDQNELTKKTSEIVEVPFEVEDDQEENFFCGKKESWMANSTPCEHGEFSKQ